MRWRVRLRGGIWPVPAFSFRGRKAAWCGSSDTRLFSTAATSISAPVRMRSEFSLNRCFQSWCELGLPFSRKLRTLSVSPFRITGRKPTEIALVAGTMTFKPARKNLQHVILFGASVQNPEVDLLDDSNAVVRIDDLVPDLIVHGRKPPRGRTKSVCTDSRAKSQHISSRISKLRKILI